MITISKKYDQQQTILINNNQIVQRKQISQVQKTTSSPLNKRLKILYEKKEKNYRSQVQQIIDQNHQLSLKIKKLSERINYLYKKLKLFLTDEQINLEPLQLQIQQQSKYEFSTNEKINMGPISCKYQKKINSLLECYGCSKTQSDIGKLNSQNEIIQFLLIKFNEKAEELRNYDNKMQNKIQNQQNEIKKLKQSLKFLKQNLQLFKLKEGKYKSKFDDFKHQITVIAQKLDKKDSAIQISNHEIISLKTKLKQNQSNIKLLQQQHKQKMQSLSKQIKNLQNRLLEMTNKNNQLNLKYQQVFKQCQESQILLKSLSSKLKQSEDQTQNLIIQLKQCKSRYELLQNQQFSYKLESIRKEKLNIKQQFSKSFRGIGKQQQSFIHTNKLQQIDLRINRQQLQQRIKRRQQEVENQLRLQNRKGKEMYSIVIN